MMREDDIKFDHVTCRDCKHFEPYEICDPEADIKMDMSYCRRQARADKVGHWITKDGKEQGYDIGGVKTWYIQIMCSECGFIKTAIEGHTGQYHFCPNCGAKMVEPQESEDKE